MSNVDGHSSHSSRPRSAMILSLLEYATMKRDEFVYTDQLDAVIIWTSLAPAIAALVANVAVLILAGVVYANHRTRKLLWRQSLLMLLSCQIAGIFMDVAFIVETLITGPTRWCEASVNVGFLTVNYINFVVTLIAVNLYLSIVYSVNTKGWTMRYLAGSLAAAVIIIIPAAVHGAWGWDLIGEECYVALTDPEERFKWQVVTQYAWTTICCLVCIVSLTHTILHLHSQRVKTRQLFTSSRSTVVEDDSLVKRVAMRVMWYPIILVICNVIEIVCDFMENKDGTVDTLNVFVLWILGGAFYGLFPFMLAIVTLFVDPSFARALRLLVWPTSQTSSDRATEAHEAKFLASRQSKPSKPIDPLATAEIDFKMINTLTSTRGSDDDALQRPKPSAHVHVDEFELGTLKDSSNVEANVDTTHLGSPPLAERLRARSGSTAQQQQISLSAL